MVAGKASEYAAMGGAGGMLLASNTRLLMPSLPGGCSRSRMAEFELLNLTMPVIWLGLRMTCPFSEAVPATEPSRVKAAKERRLAFIHLSNGLAYLTPAAAQCKHFLMLTTTITDR